jgi:hypothetical protein
MLVAVAVTAVLMGTGVEAAKLRRRRARYELLSAYHQREWLKAYRWSKGSKGERFISCGPKACELIVIPAPDPAVTRAQHQANADHHSRMAMYYQHLRW